MKTLRTGEDGHGCLLVHKRHRTTRPCPNWIVRLIASQADPARLADVLADWHRQGWHVEWECGHRHHVVRRENTIGLRANVVDRADDCPWCGIHARVGHQEATRHDALEDAFARIARRRRLGPLFITGRAEARPGEVVAATGYHPARPSSALRVRELGAIANLLAAAGLESWTPSRRELEDWKRLHDVLDSIPVRSRGGRRSESLGALSWVPGGSYAGGLPALVRRHVLANERPGRPAEGWVLAAVDRVEISGGLVTIEVSGLAHTAERSLAIRREPVMPPYRFSVEPHLVVRLSVGGQPTAGPYLALLPSVLEGVSGELRALRLVLRPILSRYSITSVDSDLERRFLGELVRRRIPFRRPVLADEFGLLPDAVLDRERIIVEVNGLDTPGYREAKRRSFRRLAAAYPRHLVLTWHANDGESLDEFAKRLCG